MTPLKQQISLIPFLIEHWYSFYKRRRFENWSDHTFCILLIKDVLSVIESANLHQRQNLKRKWTGFELGFSDYSAFGCPSNIHSKIVDTFVRLSVIHFTKFGSNRLLILWELRKQRNANKCRKIAYFSVVKKIKNRNPRADPDHHQKSTTSRGSPLARAC